jgi:hypothetical protein
MMLKITFLLIVLTFANVSWSQSLTISSTGQTGTSGTNWSLASNVLTITGPADVNASVISGHLASNNLSLSGVVNISVNAAISWSTNTTLTLNASQNILVYRDITASGSSPELNIYYGGSNATTAPNNTYIYALSQRNRNKINFSSSSAVFRVGNETYSVVTNLSQLTQAMSNATSSTRVALGASISLSQTYTNSLFPINFEGKFDGSFAFLEELELTPVQIFEGINKEIFHNHNIGANLYIDNLKGANGELGLRVGDTDKYFGVINVGDEKKLHDLAMNNGILGTDKDFSESLFAQINHLQPKQEINMLIGSKKFTEGWSSWRVSSMGLMNIGKSEGSQIIQLFGRGVRLQGYEFSLKRSLGLDDYQRPANLKQVRKHLRPLETLQIFGVKANYMERFKELLEEEGLPTNSGDWVTITIPTQNKIDISTSDLKLIQVKESENFKKKEILTLELNTDVFRNKQVEVDWYPKIDTLESTKSSRVETTKQVCYLEENHFAFIDWTKLYFEIQNFKANKGFPNLEIELTLLQDIVKNNSWYRVFIPKDKMEFSSFKNVSVWQELATILLKKYIEQYYLYFKNRFNAENIETRKLLPTDDNLILQYDIRLNKNEDVDDIDKKFRKLKTDFTDSAFKSIQIATQVEAFDNLMHLYKPLIYVGKGYESKLQVFPVALNESEHQFMKDFEVQIAKIKDSKKLEDVFLLRNQSKKGIGFFAEGNNFYPDFILWIKKDGKQYLTFIDPKGIRNSKGMNDPKIQFYKYLADKVQPQVINEDLILNSFIVSNTKWIEVNWKDSHTISDFNDNHVYFQEEQSGEYITKMINKLF